MLFSSTLFEHGDKTPEIECFRWFKKTLQFSTEPHLIV